jgi:hypothetical protein
VNRIDTRPNPAVESRKVAREGALHEKLQTTGNSPCRAVNVWIACVRPSSQNRHRGGHRGGFDRSCRTGRERHTTNKDTTFVSNGLTQSDGSYYIPFLAVGSYGLSVEAAEFKRYLQSGHPTGSRRGAAPGCQDGHRRSDRIRASRRRSPATTDRDSGFSRLLILSKLDLQPCLVHPCR